MRTFTEEEVEILLNSRICEKPKTNADRIRSFSDEELALFLCNIHEPDEDTIVIDDKEFFAETEILEWLQSEVEE